MSKKKSSDRPEKMIAFRMPSKDVESVERLARLEGLSRSAYIRDALKNQRLAIELVDGGKNDERC